MREPRFPRFPPAPLAATVGGLALLGCCWIMATAYVRTRTGHEIIRVTGSARRPIRSDFIIWRGRVAVRGPNLSHAYEKLKSDMDKTLAYIQSKGVAASEITSSAISTKTLYEKTKTPSGSLPADDSDTYRAIEGYELTQDVEVRSGNVDRVGDISRAATELIKSDVTLESLPPQYIYTRLSDMKVTMLAEAAKDARLRAEQIASNAGCRVGEVRFARMGPLQITPIYSNEVAGGGINDTSSLDKEITAIVTMGFEIR